ncbi:MAG: saccharopine dehydrogenase C-terminal domain-containing protein [Candidatus Marinimicrobia bacterium]|nr:saccharopine dehydrogenase C-terminal domain-containing protein [Candidatus Neomarinimicrobiota bacterium]
MKQKIIVLGGGMVGSAIARDLHDLGYDITVADRDIQLKKMYDLFEIDFLQLDFSDHFALKSAITSFPNVVGAVPGFMGYTTLKTVIESGKNIVDISFMPEDAQLLHTLAEEKGVTAIVDAGVAPGLSNLYFGQAISMFDELESAKCFVGGLPQNPKPPWYYKSVFSPIDVIEEYTRPARLVKNGEIVTKPAMTEIEQIDFPDIGKLDAFNSDGLRSLLNLSIPNMVEKTLRFPGHIQKVIALRNEGKFSEDNIQSTAASLIVDWAPNALDKDQTVMRLEFYGKVAGENYAIRYDLHDKYDRENNITSMARTTGYTCTAALQLLLSNQFSMPGVFNLEDLGNNPQFVSAIFEYLKNRGISLTENPIEINQEV